MHVNDVRVFDFYALLIGVDAHRFVFHSIYKGNLKKINNRFH